MYHFYVQRERDGKGGTSACHYESVYGSGVSRISFRGGVQNTFEKKWGYLLGEATCLLGGSGVCSLEKILKNGAIWCVLENI